MEGYAKISAPLVDRGQTCIMRVQGPGVAKGEPLRFPPLEEMTSKQAAAFFLAAVDALDGKGPSVCVAAPRAYALPYGGATLDTASELVRAAARAIKGEGKDHAAC